MSKRKERLKLCLKLNSNTIERFENEKPEEYISRVFQMAHKEHDEHFFVSLEGVLASSHIQYIKVHFNMIPKRLHRFKDERFYLCEYSLIAILGENFNRTN